MEYNKLTVQKSVKIQEISLKYYKKILKNLRILIHNRTCSKYAI